MTIARNIILTGGVGHPFATAAPALRDALAEVEVDSAITDDIEAGLAEAVRTRPDLLTVYALRWTMHGSAKYAQQRAAGGFSLSDSGRAGIRGHLARGGGLLAFHTALVCFDDWPEWRDILGAVWTWNRSSHPPYGPIEVRPQDVDHPIVRDARPFALNDEAYGDLDRVPDLAPLMHARAAGGAWHPILWPRRVGPGRVVCDALGHDAGAFLQPDHRRIVQRAALWALGRSDADVAAA
jgi:type 1 glutamine amidotransferase